jgi:hypothetical protein
MRMDIQYQGIIKCLPEKWYNDVGGEKYLTRTFGERANNPDWWFYMSMAGKPKYDVLHCYLLINGYLRFRLNIAEYLPGGTMIFRDRPIPQEWTARNWMILTPPIVSPPEPIRMKGFQGFRYTEKLF